MVRIIDKRGQADRLDDRQDAMERSRELVEEMDAVADRYEAALTELGGLNQQLADAYTRIMDASSSEPEADRRIEEARIEIQELMDSKKAEIAHLDNVYKCVEIEYERFRFEHFRKRPSPHTPPNLTLEARSPMGRP